MKFIESENLIETAIWLLGRPLTPEDGIPRIDCESAEHRLNCKLPLALREFYEALGNNAVIMSSFQQFYRPEQLLMSSDKIVFAEENQGVCHWAVDAQDKVHQSQGLERPEWHEEPKPLAEFLRVLLCYQMAQAGYPYSAMISSRAFQDFDEVQGLIGEMEGQPLVDMSGLQIFARPNQVLIWFLKDESVDAAPDLFLSVLRKETFDELCDEWSFEDLG